jgi:hypothetical protein
MTFHGRDQTRGGQWLGRAQAQGSASHVSSRITCGRTKNSQSENKNRKLEITIHASTSGQVYLNARFTRQ